MQVKGKPKSGGLFARNPVFRQFTPTQIETIMIRVRIMIAEERKRIDGELKYYVRVLYTSQSPVEQYLTLQQICLRLLEIKSNKIIVQYVQRVIDNKSVIADADGSVYKIQEQSKWIQMLAWYINQKKLGSGQEYLTFCLEFFKGVDILGDLSFESRLPDDVKGCKLKLNEIRFHSVKDWLDTILQEFPQSTLNNHLQLNNLFISNEFTNTQIKEYFANQQYQEPTSHPTRSYLIPNTDPNSLNNGFQNESGFNNNCNYPEPRNSSSQMKQTKAGSTVPPRETTYQISVEQRYSILLIKQSLQTFSTAQNQVTIHVAPINYDE